MALRLVGDIAKAVIARRLRMMIVEYDEIREVAGDDALSNEFCALIAKSIERRTWSLAHQLMRGPR